MYKVILSKTSNMQMASPDIQIIFKDTKSFHRLTGEDSYDRFKLN